MNIDRFTGEHRWLSNFHPAPIEWEGIRYPTSEHAYQAAKSLDIEERKRIAALPSPGDAKRYGRKVNLRSDWEEVKLSVMYQILLIKFSDASLKKKLLSTAPHTLTEGNTWGDTYWGVCRGRGRNELGKALMRLRDSLVGE